MTTRSTLANLLDWEDAPSLPFSPDATLCLAVLERANRDLGETIETHIKRDAVNWFNSYFNNRVEEKDENIFSFENIIDICGLTMTQVKYLEERVKEVESNYGRKNREVCLPGREVEAPKERKKVEKKRRYRREGVGRIFKREWLSDSQENRPVQRQNGTLSCRRSSR